MRKNKTTTITINLLDYRQVSSLSGSGIKRKLNSYLFKLLILLRRTAYLSLNYASIFIRQSENQIHIFCYHSVAEDSGRFSVSFEDLKKQVNYLLSKFKQATLNDIKLHITGEKKITDPSFVLTFDDGYKDILQTKEYFKRLGVRPAIFILSDRNNVAEKELEVKRKFLNNKEILKLREAGWEIGCHSATHADFSKLSEDDMKKEIIEAKRDLEKELGIPISYFSYPKGKYSPKILSAVSKAGYTLGVSMDDFYLDETTNLLALPRIGVDRTHTFREFKTLPTLPAMVFRRYIKKLF